MLVTGGAGSIGSELVRQLAPSNEVYVLDINETAFFDLHEELNQKGFKVQGRVGNIKAHSTVDDAIWEFRPDVIFHAAACKHVTPMEWTPLEAVHTNIIGTHNLVKYAKRYSVKKFVNISTDKVVHAESIMGLTKKIAEKMVKNAGFVSVRFGNVLGSRGSVIPIWQKQLDEGRPLTVTDARMERYMMTIPEAVRLVVKAAEVGKPGQVLILDMGEPVNILQLAKDILAKSGKDLGVEMIGVRPGETLTERLMTLEEQSTAVKVDDFWVLQ